jgi:uncharacterized membrane protein
MVAMNSSVLLLPVSCWFLVWLARKTLRGRRYYPIKPWITFKLLHGVISQKIELFITTALRTSNLQRKYPSLYHIDNLRSEPVSYRQKFCCVTKKITFRFFKFKPRNFLQIPRINKHS